jgi:hypothetical protein
MVNYTGREPGERPAMDVSDKVVALRDFGIAPATMAPQVCAGTVYVVAASAIERDCGSQFLRVVGVPGGFPANIFRLLHAEKRGHPGKGGSI